MPEQPPARPVPPQRKKLVRVEPKAVPLAKPSANYVPIQGVPLAKTAATNIPPKREEARPVETKQKETEEQPDKLKKKFTKMY